MFDLANPEVKIDTILEKFKSSTQALRVLVAGNEYYKSLMDDLSKESSQAPEKKEKNNE